MSHWLISVAAAELGDEVGVEPRLVDAQVGVGEQAVAVEPLDVVALEGRAVAPDVDAVLVHRAHQQRAGDGAAERRGVEVGAAAGADVERAAGQRGQALLDQLRPCSRRSGPARRRTAARGRGRRRCRARRTGRCRRCRCTGWRPCRASTRRRRRCRGRRRTRCRRARRRAGRSEPCSRVGPCLRRVGAGACGAVGQRQEASARAWPPVGSRLMTRTVSSPAMVPRMSSSSALSKAQARNWAAPGGVRSTTRLAVASALTSSSPSSRASRSRPRRSRGPRGCGRRPRRARRRRARRGAAHLDRVELDEVAATGWPG